MSISIFFVFLLALFVMSGLRRRARQRDAIGVAFVQVREQQLDISQAVHRIPAVRRQS